MGSPLPVVVDFFTDGCAPCRMLAPKLEEIEGERAGRVKVVKVNASAEASLAARFGVRTVRTLLLFRGGECVGQRVGDCGKRELAAWADGV